MAEKLITFNDRYTDDLHAEVERRVDTEGISYHDARLALGIYDADMFDADQTERSLPEAAAPVPVSPSGAGQQVMPVAHGHRRAPQHGPRLGEETGVGYPHGKPFEHQSRTPRSDEQRARNQKWFDVLRGNPGGYR